MAWIIREEVWDSLTDQRLSSINHSTRFSSREGARDEACRLSLHEGPDSVFVVIEEGCASEASLHRFCQGKEV